MRAPARGAVRRDRTLAGGGARSAAAVAAGRAGRRDRARGSCCPIRAAWRRRCCWRWRRSRWRRVAIGRGGRAARAVGGRRRWRWRSGWRWSGGARSASPRRCWRGRRSSRCTARVERVEPLPARELVRLTLAPIAVARRRTVPPRGSASISRRGDVPDGAGAGRGRSRLRARLMPPPRRRCRAPMISRASRGSPGLGATGRGFAPVTVVTRRRRRGRGPARGADRGTSPARLDGQRGRDRRGAGDGRRRRDRRGGCGGDAARRAGAPAVGQRAAHHRGGRGDDAARRCGCSRSARGWRCAAALPLIAAVAGAVAAIGYTLLTGSEVPTIRVVRRGAAGARRAGDGARGDDAAAGRGGRADRAAAVARSAGRAELPAVLRRGHRDRRAARTSARARLVRARDEEALARRVLRGLAVAAADRAGGRDSR